MKSSVVGLYWSNLRAPVISEAIVSVVNKGKFKSEKECSSEVLPTL